MDGLCHVDLHTMLLTPVITDSVEAEKKDTNTSMCTRTHSLTLFVMFFKFNHNSLRCLDQEIVRSCLQTDLVFAYLSVRVCESIRLYAAHAQYIRGRG